MSGILREVEESTVDGHMYCVYIHQASMIKHGTGSRTSDLIRLPTCRAGVAGLQSVRQTSQCRTPSCPKEGNISGHGSHV